MTLVVGMPKKNILSKINKNYDMIIWITLLTTILVTLLGYLLLHRYFVAPLERINKQLQDDNTMLECIDKGEIGELVKNLNLRTVALKDSQTREKDEMNKRLINEKLLIQQSKMAAMGEMMDAVAHQWKQPLNALSMYSDIIKSDFKDGAVDNIYMDDFTKNIHIQIDHMVNTLDEFRAFFRPSKTEETFTILDIIKSVQFLTKDEFMKNRITIEVESHKNIELYGSKNEFKHLVLNIINNSKDAFNDNDIKERRFITIRLLEDNGRDKIEIEDNAGGIPKSVLADIFKANVTTKAEGKGTGIGLYMSMQIAEKFNAKLIVDNRNSGACFSILF
jgi:C4-dicarboxylate-specific signal transduction histidine kinase